MSNQETAKKQFLNSQLWEEITDTQSEAISGGAPSLEDVTAKVEAIGAVVSQTPNFDPEKTLEILSNVLDKNGAINKFFS